MTRFPRILLRASTSLLVLMLAACAGRAVKPQSAEDLVRERAQVRWDLMIARDFDAAYKYLTPGTRLAVSVEDFKNKYRGMRVDWRSASVQAVECTTDERCKVKVEVAFKVVGGVQGVADLGGTQVVDETWLAAQDGWYYLPN